MTGSTRDLRECRRRRRSFVMRSDSLPRPGRMPAVLARPAEVRQRGGCLVAADPGSCPLRLSAAPGQSGADWRIGRRERPFERSPPCCTARMRPPTHFASRRESFRIDENGLGRKADRQTLNLASKHCPCSRTRTAPSFAPNNGAGLRWELAAQYRRATIKAMIGCA